MTVLQQITQRTIRNATIKKMVGYYLLEQINLDTYKRDNTRATNGRPEEQSNPSNDMVP
jgi:hypothetical protein